VRFKYQKDYENDCITICDEKEELKTSFDSEIILFPMEDGIRVIDELNVQCAIVDMLVGQLKSYEDIQDIQYWIDEVKEDFEE
jgi:hypothetical protein